MARTAAGRYSGIAGTGRQSGQIPARPTRPAASPSNVASGAHVPPGQSPPAQPSPMTSRVVRRRPRSSPPAPKTVTGQPPQSGSQPTDEDERNREGHDPSELFAGAARTAGSGARGLLHGHRVSLAEFLLGLGTWAVVLNGIRYGPAGVSGWFRAKWLNQPMNAPAASSSSTPQQPLSASAAEQEQGVAGPVQPPSKTAPPARGQLRPVA